MGGWVGGWIGGWVGRWVGGWVGGWIGGRVGGWVEEGSSQYIKNACITGDSAYDVVVHVYLEGYDNVYIVLEDNDDPG